MVRRLQAKRKERAAVTIQRIYRGHRQRTAYESTLRFIIIVQSLARRRRARAVARRLKMEAKSVAHFKHKTGALEKKLFELTQVLAAKESHTEKISEKMATLEMQVRASKEKMEKMEAKRHAVELHAQRKVNDLEGHVQRLDDHKSKLERELAETAKLAKAREEQIKKTRKLAEALQAENQRLLEKQQQDDRRQEYQEKLAAIAADNAALKEKLAMLYKTASQTYRGRQSSPADSPSVARSRGSTERRTSVQRSPSASSLRKESPRNGRVVDSKTANVSAADPVQPPRIVMNGTSRASTHTNLLTVTAGSPRLPGSKAATGGHPTSPVVTHPEVIELLNDPALDGELAAVVGAATVMPREDLEFGQKRTREEGLCPAHLVALCVVQAWRFELSERVRVLLSHNTQAVQNLIVCVELWVGASLLLWIVFVDSSLFLELL